jgi:hypothetical protein
MQIELTPENAARIAEYAQLTGWTAHELVNHLLDETMAWWDDPKSGSLEGFLGSIYYHDLASVERALAHITGMVRKDFQGNLPASFESEIREHADGRFNFRAKYIDRHGDIQSFC